ncbi:kinase-like protein [Cucurbitaria berberidis CBS 394.84]|uniref:non-specific serine/threonine protein kinase n=1 Tax=Cucurbitaria berberidis CBS 394.84 TaxID=1168544 RepID=A0A9P4LCJ8_9PLEO|nr:kinase-like protein [Cucurbitaria berberidis CBS 394.84]KAF1849244.1 kinase-like protein [Cucurbitaria berberidis CBS 394.84]
MSKPKGPPYASGLPYLKRSTETYCGGNRTTWTGDDIKLTALTIWYGDSTVRDYYNSRVRKKREYPLPAPNTIPAHPYNQQDVDHARAHKALPPYRDAAGHPIPPSLLLPPDPGVQRALPPQPRPINQYPFDFWAPIPWDPEPEDPTPGASIEEIIGTDEDHEDNDLWMGNNPNMWPVGDESMWRGGKFLGAGAFGCAGLWCEVNATNHVQRHVVVKEVRPRGRQWRDPIQWRDRLPREIRIHQIVDGNRPPAAGVRGHRNLIHHQGYRLMMEQRRYRLYLRYYAGGDLYANFKGHFQIWRRALREKKRFQVRRLGRERAAQRRKANRKTPAVGRENDKQKEDEEEEEEEEEEEDEEEEEPSLETMAVIPEGFIWHVFSQLVNACEVLQTGAFAPAAADANWKAITHLDIKMDNVFVEPPTGDGFPNTVLSDFGLSFYPLEHSDATTLDNPQEYVFEKQGTNYAPEHQFLHGAPGNWTILGEKTDVWSIGSLIWKFLANTYIADGPRREIISDRGTVVNEWCAGLQDPGQMGAPGATPPFTGLFYPAFRMYSEELRNLVARCLNWEPQHRPTLREIRRAIDEFLENNPAVRDDRDTGPLSMAALDDGLKINDVFQSKRRAPVRL